MLDRGLKLGFIAGTDTHATMPSGGGVEPGHIDRAPGLTAVFARELTRASVYGAIRDRNCYAASLERIYLRGRLAGEKFGGCLRWKDLRKPRIVEIAAAGKSNLQTVEVIRNGRRLARLPGSGWNGKFSFIDEEPLDKHLLDSKYLGRFAYYYVRVTCESGAQAWSSPVWLIC